MYDQDKWEKIKDGDPNQCQATTAQGQCPFRAVGTLNQQTGIWDGAKYCPRHGGNSGDAKQAKSEHRQYLSAMWQERIGFQADHPKIKSLREEIGILRMTLESKLNLCRDETELQMRAQSITELVREISKVVKTCHVLDRDMNTLLDKTQALEWVQELVTLIAQYVPEESTLADISKAMIDSLERRTKPHINSLEEL